MSDAQPESLDARPSTATQSDNGSPPAQQPSFKRQRIAVACQRCKSRKQKCDGLHPTCSSCSKSSSVCEYVYSRIPKALEQKLYVKALEERVAELESGLAYDGNAGVADDHWERMQPSGQGTISLSTAIRELSLCASGFYVGGTTHITLGRLLESAFPDSKGLLPNHETSSPDMQSSDLLKSNANSTHPNDLEQSLDLSLFSKPNAEDLFQAYIKHVALEYPIIHSRKLRDIHTRRHNLSDVFEVAVLHFVYAIGGSSLKLAGENGDNFSEDHHECAMRYKDTIVHCLDRRSVIYLALATIYSLRSPTSPGPWVLTVFAVELCIMLGLHRKAKSTKANLASEMDKRLFWTCYSLDRHSSIATGRPPTISDHDIDVPLPLDIDEDSTSLEGFRKALTKDPTIPSNPPTTLTEFVHFVRIRRIHSRIQHLVYRVDQVTNPSHEIIDAFLTQLTRWQTAVSLQDSQPEENAKMTAQRQNSSQANELYMIHYYLGVRLLLFPQLSEPSVDERYLGLCASACIGVCESYNKLYLNSTAICLPPAVTQWLFLSGLTLIFCMWHSPQTVVTTRATSAIHSCSSMLYVMAERWPPAKQYRNAFERLKENVFEHIASGAQVPRDPLPSSTFNTAAHDALNQVFTSAGMESVGQAFKSITSQQEPVAEKSPHLNIAGFKETPFVLDNLGFPVLSEDEPIYEDKTTNIDVTEFDTRQDLAFENVGFAEWGILDAMMTSQLHESDCGTLHKAP